MGGSWLRDNQTERAVLRVQTKLGALPVELSDPINAASWLKRPELALPCPGAARRTRALFVEDTKSLTPLSHATVDRYLSRLLRAFLPPAEAAKYSFHSFRVGLACALLAAGCPPATIQALARWRSDESLKIYARLNPSDYASWVSKALLQRTDSATTRGLPTLPLLGEFALFESFRTSAAYFARAQDLDD